MPSAPCSIIGFYPFPSRYRNVIRSKDEDYPSFRPPSRNLIRIIRRRSRVKPGMRGIKPTMRGIGAAKTILPPRWGSLFYRIQRGFTPPPMFYRPYRANHDSAFYITGVHTPAYALSPLQGYIIFHFSFFIFHCLRRLSSPLGKD